MLLMKNLMVFLHIFLVGGCQTSRSDLAENRHPDAHKDETNIEQPAPLRPWLNYYGIAGQGELFQLSDNILKQNLFTILDSVHCVDPSGMRADTLIPSPVVGTGSYHYIKWLDEAQQACQKLAKNYQAKMHRALGYGTRDQVNPRDHPELRHARFYLYHDFDLGHLQKDDQGKFIIDVYGMERFGGEAGVGESSGRNPNGNLLNCEHTWPKSRFAISKKGSADYHERESDLHHLFPTKNSINGWRSSFPFAEVSGGESREISKKNLVLLGPANLSPLPGVDLSHLRQQTNTERYFQPPSAHRGNVARALFYFAIRYQLKIAPIEEYYLRKWHRDDPIDKAELRRNDRIAKLQRTRNPFIDFPELVDQINDF